MSPYWNYLGFTPITVQIQVASLEPADLGEHLATQSADLREAVAQGYRSFIIIEGIADHRASPEVRRMQTEWMSAHRDMLAATSLGVAFVVEGRILRGVISAIMWVSQPPVAYTIQPSRAAALAHALSVCDRQALAVPDAARRGDAADVVEAALREHLRPRGTPGATKSA